MVRPLGDGRVSESVRDLLFVFFRVAGWLAVAWVCVKTNFPLAPRSWAREGARS